MVESIPIDILRQHPPIRANPFRKSDGVIAVSSANIGHRHSVFYFGEIHHRLRFAATVTLVFSRKLVRTQVGHSPVWLRKARLVVIDENLPLARAKHGKRKDQGRNGLQSSSSTSTISPVTRCAKAAEMN